MAFSKYPASRPASEDICQGPVLMTSEPYGFGQVPSSSLGLAGPSGDMCIGAWTGRAGEVR